MNIVYILLGANLGSPISQIEQSIQLLSQKIGNIFATSSLYESEAWGVEDQPIFFNQVIGIETTLTPSECLLTCQEVELTLGRIRDTKWGARVIDIDILYFNNEIINTSTLQVPHPYIHLRNFTLIPLAEIASDYIHPTLQLSNQQLLLETKDKLRVRKYGNTL